VKNRYCIDTISILTILTNTIRYRYGIDASGIEAEPAADQKLGVRPLKPSGTVSEQSNGPRFENVSVEYSRCRGGLLVIMVLSPTTLLVSQVLFNFTR
jgi:hypothetical protein